MTIIELDELFDLYRIFDKELIAYGTGDTGKLVIPYLAANFHISLLGVTNSRLTKDYEGEFQDTKLPLRSLAAWAKLCPDAAILVTIHSLLNRQAVIESCKKQGFSKIITLSSRVMYAIAYAVTNVSSVNWNVVSSWAIPTGNPMLTLLCTANEIRDVHKATFSEFKACHKGKSVVVAATGPTLNFYSPIKGVPHIGMNGAYKKGNLNLDYLFWQDFGAVEWAHNWKNDDSIYNYGVAEWAHELKHYDCIKFFGQSLPGPFRDIWAIPENIIEENNGRRYYTAVPNEDIHLNIEYYPLMGLQSVVFSALHFALYTRPKKILLVGCDCSYSDQRLHFYSNKKNANNMHYNSAFHYWLKGYEKFK